MKKKELASQVLIELKKMEDESSYLAHSVNNFLTVAISDFKPDEEIVNFFNDSFDVLKKNIGIYLEKLEHCTDKIASIEHSESFWLVHSVESIIVTMANLGIISRQKEFVMNYFNSSEIEKIISELDKNGSEHRMQDAISWAKGLLKDDNINVSSWY
jgi:hypothetical protein